MTERPIRDILAECMRRERYGLIRPLWADASGEGQEQVRRRADHLMRLLRDYGVELVRTGKSKAPPAEPESLVIWRFPVHGKSLERIIRKAGGDAWEIVALDDGKETVEQSFSIEQAQLNGGLVLTEHPDLRNVPGLGKQLAALNEIYRLHAESTRGPE